MLQARPSRPAHRSAVTQEHRVFLVAVGVGLLHALDDAVLNRQPGVPVTRHLLALLVVILAATAAAWAFPRLRPGLRSAVSVVAGVLTAANGALHAVQIVTSSFQGSDATGVLAAAAGLVLVGLGAVIPWRHRGERPARPVHRWLRRAFVVVTGAVATQLVLVPVVVGMVQTHKFREEVGEPPSGFRAVSFRSADGLELAGWYRPSRNGAAVVVVNSAGGDRTGSVRHAELLGRHGYGVLTYDARGSGESDGSPNGWGWGWDADVAGALDFVRARDDVQAGRVGGLGLSTGADVLLEVAAQRSDLRTVVADGATARSFADRPPGLLYVPMVWTMLTAGQLFSGTSPGEPLTDLVARAAPTPILLVASGSLPGELYANRRYAAAGPSTTLWELPDVTHTNAVEEVASDYERRVIGHLDATLLRGTGVPSPSAAGGRG